MAKKVKPNLARLLKAAAFLDTWPKRKFQYDITRQSKGKSFVACGVGLLPEIFPKLVAAGKPAAPGRYHPLIGDIPLILRATGRKATGNGSKLAARIYGISEAEVKGIFTADFCSPADGGYLGSDTTPKQLACRIRTYVTWVKEGRPS